jgi:hypothetical protein
VQVSVTALPHPSDHSESARGRLGTYRYLDMDVTIAEALDAAAKYLLQTHRGGQYPRAIHASARESRPAA